MVDTATFADVHISDDDSMTVELSVTFRLTQEMKDMSLVRLTDNIDTHVAESLRGMPALLILTKLTEWKSRG